MTNYATKRSEAEAYYALCAEARERGIPVSLDDPASPQTVEALRAAIKRDDETCGFCGGFTSSTTKCSSCGIEP